MFTQISGNQLADFRFILNVYDLIHNQSESAKKTNIHRKTLTLH